MVVRNRNTLEALHEEHRLLAVLRALQRLPGHAASLLLLRDHLDALGLVTSHDVMRTEVQHLKEMELCTVNTIDDAYRVTLTERGMDVAEGRSEVEGIRKPGPECPY
ncbi:MAG: ArsR family transcriptional regulator [Acidiferrobacterales bacterium]